VAGMTVSAGGSDVPAADSVACACLRLGWRMEEMFGRFDVPEGPPHAYDTAQLPGLSKLTSYDQQRLGLDEVDFVVDQVTSRFGRSPAGSVQLTIEVRSKLDATIQAREGAEARRDEYRIALGELHVNLLVTLTAADSCYGKAYGLGRALADTTRPGQTPGELTSAFAKYRIGQLYVWLDDLASVLPPHAARAVAQSMAWWQHAVTAASSGSKLSTSSLPASYLASSESPPSRWRQATATFGRRRGGARTVQTDPPPADSLAAAVARQGAVWRAVLDGDKLCTDLLTSQDYLRAGDRLARHYADLVGRTLRTMPWLLILLMLVLLAVVLLLVFIPGSAVARTATAVVAIAGTFSGAWKIVRTRVAPIAAQLEKPLWGAELNTATAEAVTVPPLGAPRSPEWESAFAAADAEAATPSTPAPTQPAPSPG
jgi:hypothetical protein